MCRSTVIFGIVKKDSLWISILTSTVVSVTETFSKIASKFCMVQTIRFCSNFTSMWSKYLWNNVWRDLDFSVSISNGNMKCPIRKSIFTVNLPSKLFCATVANADIERVKSLHTFLKKCFYHMPVKFEQNRMVYTTRNFELFWQKTVFFL